MTGISSRNMTAGWVVGVMAALSGIVVGWDLIDGTVSAGLSWIVWVGGLLQTALLIGVGWLVLPRRRILSMRPFLSAVAGGTFAVAGAMFVNGGSALVAPFAEEILKLLVVASMVWLCREAISGPLDGLVIGYFVGLGLEVVEDVQYGLTAAAANDVAGTVHAVVERTYIGFGLHSLFTAIAACGLVWAVVRGRRAWLTAAGCLLVAIALHWGWDNLLSVISWPVMYLLIAGAFAGTRIIAGRAETRTRLVRRD